MSNQPPNAWQTAGRSRHSQSASRTPQNRSGTASPSQQTQPTQPPRQDSGRSQQVNNVWAQRSSSASGSNGQRVEQPQTQQEEQYTSLNGFNVAEVKAALSVDAAAATSYKPAEASGASRGSGSAWGSKPNHMANNQPFFVQLAKQIATLEGGG